MLRLLGLLLIFSAQFSFALETYQTPGSSAKQYLYSEGGGWKVDAIQFDSEQWPNIQASHSFTSELEARQYLQNIGAYYSPAVDAMARGRELKGRNGNTLWTVTNQWSWDWEIKYGEWVKNTLHVSWWKQYGIATDCADVAYSARWVFARNNGLPMANTMISGNFFTQRSVKTEWETLPTAPEWYNDQKFLAALNYLMSTTYTHSLWGDSYPIAVNPNVLIPGTHHLHLAGNTGHTMLVHSVGTKPEDVPVEVLYSNIPTEVRDLWGAVFLDQTSDSSGAGFVHFRWPQWVNDVVSLVPGQQMPNYSEEQFDPNFIQSPRYAFWQEVFYRLNPRADFDKIAYKTLQQLLDGFRTRVQVVDRGWAVCSATPCKEGSHEWELWSTPSRDGRLLTAVGVFDELMMQVGDYSQFQPLLGTTIFNLGGGDVSLSEAMRVWRAGSYSSDPNDEPKVRWGL